jgi:hypothetical protein
MKSLKSFGAAIALLLLVLTIGQSAFAQSDQAVDYQINALRADLKATKADIVDQAMQLKPAEAQAFWPVYKQYDAELSTVNDELVQIIKTYADKYGNINDADASKLTNKFLDVQSNKLAVKKRYFPLFSKATSPLTAAKFFQVDNRLELLFNLKLASELPPLLMQSPAPAKGK